MLSRKTAEAQRAARELHDSLIKTNATNMTAFEKGLAEDHRMEMLASFADQQPPVVLWRAQRR